MQRSLKLAEERHQTSVSTRIITVAHNTLANELIINHEFLAAFRTLTNHEFLTAFRTLTPCSCSKTILLHKDLRDPVLTEQNIHTKTMSHDTLPMRVVPRLTRH